MQKLIIKGKKELSGKISISGSKNATLTNLSCINFSKQCKINKCTFSKRYFYNVRLLLKFIGIKIKINKNKKTLIEIKKYDKK